MTIYVGEFCFALFKVWRLHRLL